ncbi:MAG: VWA domain-containing protein, partial [Thermoanaerobaculia bacterium]|nr:VWA domain-containing protein [Thermoanaerobaculia bacterium]
FTEIQSGRATTALTAGGATGRGSAPVPEGQPVPTRYLVFIDNLFSLEKHRNDVLDALEEDVDALGPDDWMAIVEFDGRRLERLIGWENRHEPLREALREARSRPSSGLHRLAEIREVDDWRNLERAHIEFLEQRLTAGARGAGPNNDDNAQDSGDGLLRAIDNLKNMTLEKAGAYEVDYATMVRSQIRAASLGAAAAMRGFSQARGRKALLLLAGGWPSSALEYAISDGTQTTSLLLDASMKRMGVERDDPLFPMVDAANLIGYTIYPIDVPGFQRADTIREGATDDTMFSTDEKEPAEMNELQRERELFHHDSLEFVAFDTGGEALINAQRLHALPTVRLDTRDYYWLGFSRDREDDDARHEIEIRVERPGVDVRARTGFVDMSRGTEADLEVEAALRFDNLIDTGPLDLTLGEPLDPRKKRLEVPLDIRIPLDEVTMVPTNGFYYGDIEIRISVMDEKGNTASSDVRSVSVEGAEPPPPGAHYTYSTTLEIRNRNHKIVVGVHDTTSGASLSGSTRLSPAG